MSPTCKRLRPGCDESIHEERGSDQRETCKHTQVTHYHPNQRRDKMTPSLISHRDDSQLMGWITAWLDAAHAHSSARVSWPIDASRVEKGTCGQSTRHRSTKVLSTTVAPGSARGSVSADAIPSSDAVCCLLPSPYVLVRTVAHEAITNMAATHKRQTGQNHS